MFFLPALVSFHITLLTFLFISVHRNNSSLPGLIFSPFSPVQDFPYQLDGCKVKSALCHAHGTAASDMLTSLEGAWTMRRIVTCRVLDHRDTTTRSSETSQRKAFIAGSGLPFLGWTSENSLFGRLAFPIGRARADLSNQRFWQRRVGLSPTTSNIRRRLNLIYYKRVRPHRPHPLSWTMFSTEM